MALFRYKAVSADGGMIEGEIDAENEESAIRRLQADGHRPISARPKTRRSDLPTLADRILGWKKRIAPAELSALTRELSTLLSAGVAIDAALRVVKRHEQNERLRSLLNEVHADVQSGGALSQALAKHPSVFDALYVNLIRAGEASGGLEVVLQRLADHRERSDAFRSSMVTSLTYPLILLAVALLSLFVLMSFVIPRFIPMFSDSGAALPLLTQFVFAMARFFQSYWWGLIGVVALAKLAADRWLSAADNRRRLHAWSLRAPIAGTLIRDMDTVRFTRTLATILRNGLPLLSGLKLARQVVKNQVVSDGVGRCIEAVQAGGRLADVLRRESVLPHLVIELITVGEESGQLEAMLEKSADTLESRVQQKLKQLLTLLEPMLILGLGGMIALVIVAILMAMLGLNELVV